MEIRRYRLGEEQAVWNVYFRSTREVISTEYTIDQVLRWAPDRTDPSDWAKRLKDRNPFVAVNDGVIVGFAELESNGHIDMFYCLPEWIGKGVGSQLLKHIEYEAKKSQISRLFAESSTLAINFFKNKGFDILEERVNTICDAPAKQYIIEKRLS